MRSGSISTRQSLWTMGNTQTGGGFFCETQNFPGIPAVVEFSNGKTSRGRIAREIWVSIIAWRFWWEDENKVMWRECAPGRAGKMQCIVLSGPAMDFGPIGLTCRGMAKQDMLARSPPPPDSGAYTGGRALRCRVLDESPGWTSDQGQQESKPHRRLYADCSQRAGERRSVCGPRCHPGTGVNLLD